MNQGANFTFLEANLSGLLAWQPRMWPIDGHDRDPLSMTIVTDVDHDLNLPDNHACGRLTVTSMAARSSANS